MLFAPITPYHRPQIQAFERFLGEVLRSPVQQSAQNETSYQLSIDMPGVSREQIRIDIDGAVVRIETLPDAPRQYRGVYELAQEIDPQASNAKLENGVLSLTLVKRQPISTAQRLQVE